MRYAFPILLFLIACAPQQPALAPATTVTFTNCDATREIGESCINDCDCLQSGTCLREICSLTKLEDGALCRENRQCLSGYCTQAGHCGGPDGPNLSYDCERECKDRYTGEPRACYTVCRHR